MQETRAFACLRRLSKPWHRLEIALPSSSPEGCCTPLCQQRALGRRRVLFTEKGRGRISAPGSSQAFF